MLSFFIQTNYSVNISFVKQAALPLIYFFPTPTADSEGLERKKLLSHKKNSVTQHQLPVFPKTSKHNVICKINNSATPHILNTKD